MVTYGDLMSLLLCFFVLLFSMSTLDIPKLSDAVESLNEGFGYRGTGEASNIDVIQQRVNAMHHGCKVHTEKEKTPKTLPDNPLQRIIIKGHTAANEHGIYRRGIDLAFTRAVTTRDYLISLGLKEEQFQIVVAGQFELLKRTQ